MNEAELTVIRNDLQTLAPYELRTGIMLLQGKLADMTAERDKMKEELEAALNAGQLAVEMWGAAIAERDKLTLALAERTVERDALTSELELARMKTYCASISDIAKERDALEGVKDVAPAPTGYEPEVKSHDLPRPYRMAVPKSVIPTIHTLHEQKHTNADIAKALGVSRATIVNIVHRRGAYRDPI